MLYLLYLNRLFSIINPRVNNKPWQLAFFNTDCFVVKQTDNAIVRSILLFLWWRRKKLLVIMPLQCVASWDSSPYEKNKIRTKLSSMFCTTKHSPRKLRFPLNQRKHGDQQNSNDRNSEVEGWTLLEINFCTKVWMVLLLHFLLSNSWILKASVPIIHKRLCFVNGTTCM